MGTHVFSFSVIIVKPKLVSSFFYALVNTKS